MKEFFPSSSTEQDNNEDTRSRALTSRRVGDCEKKKDSLIFVPLLLGSAHAFASNILRRRSSIGGEQDVKTEEKEACSTERHHDIVKRRRIISSVLFHCNAALRTRRLIQLTLLFAAQSSERANGSSGQQRDGRRWRRPHHREYQHLETWRLRHRCVSFWLQELYTVRVRELRALASRGLERKRQVAC